MFDQPPLWFIIIAFLCAIGPLVFFHELGHYLVARMVRRRGRAILDRLRPGNCRLDRQARNALEGRLAAAGRLCPVRRRHEPGQPGRMPTRNCRPKLAAVAFHHKPWWQRFLIVLAGPVANFLLAIAIFAAFFAMFGMPRTPALVGQVQPGSVAAAVGSAAWRPDRGIAGQDVGIVRRYAPGRLDPPGRTQSTITVDRCGRPAGNCDDAWVRRRVTDEFGQILPHWTAWAFWRPARACRSLPIQTSFRKRPATPSHSPVR